MPEPAHTIREYLDANDAQVEVPFHNLLTTWRLEEASTADRALIADELAAAGVETEPPLTELARDEAVVLRVTPEDEGREGIPPWESEEAITEVAPVEAVGAAPLAEPTDPEPTKRRLSPVLLAVAALAALAAAGGGYFLGQGTGEDLDAAREAGRQAGQREGAARGAGRGYDAGYKEGRKTGYKETYKHAYDRAYEKQLRAAGIDPASVDR